MTDAPTPAPVQSVMEVYDSLFLFNFLSSFPKNQCGSPNSLDVGFLSVACILPLFVWIGMFVILLYSREMYFVLTQLTMWMLTLIQIPMLLLFDRSPPVAGCGPTHAWPCPQVSLVTCGLCCLLCYSRTQKKQPLLRIGAAFAVMVYVVHAVLYIGFADGTGVLAGVMVGCMVGCLQHELLQIVEESHPIAKHTAAFLNMLSRNPTVNTMMKMPQEVTDLISTLAQTPDNVDIKDALDLPQRADIAVNMRNGLPT